MSIWKETWKKLPGTDQLYLQRDASNSGAFQKIEIQDIEFEIFAVDQRL